MLVRSALQNLWHKGCGRVANTTLGFTLCCIAPQGHNPSAIKHSSPTLNGLLMLCGQHRAVRWLSTVSADGFCWYCTVNMTHTTCTRLYDLWGGSAFDVAHELTIKYYLYTANSVLRTYCRVGSETSVQWNLSIAVTHGPKIFGLKKRWYTGPCIAAMWNCSVFGLIIQVL